MFTLPAVVAGIALKESTDAFEAHWGNDVSVKRPSRRSAPAFSLAGLLFAFVSSRF